VCDVVYLMFCRDSHHVEALSIKVWLTFKFASDFEQLIIVNIFTNLGLGSVI